MSVVERSPLTDEQRKLVADHLALVELAARRLAGRMRGHVEVDDLRQDAIFGLMDAARRFDPSRGFKFSTFADERVRFAMVDGLRRSGELWPRSLRRERRDISEAVDDLRRERRGEPSRDEIAGRLGWDQHRLERAILRIRTVEATSPRANGDGSLNDALPSAFSGQRPASPYERMAARATARELMTAISRLPVRLQRVIRLYHFEDRTMKEIGDLIGVNESRVSQLHVLAMNRLRDELQRRPPAQPMPAPAPQAKKPKPAPLRSRAASPSAQLEPLCRSCGKRHWVVNRCVDTPRPRRRPCLAPALTPKATADECVLRAKHLTQALLLRIAKSTLDGRPRQSNGADPA